MSWRELTLSSPGKLVFGKDCIGRCGESVAARKFARVLVICSPSTRRYLERLALGNATVEVLGNINREPTVAVFEESCKAAAKFKPDVVIGLGGGSPLDLAKLVAALWNSKQKLTDVFGIGLLANRGTPLFCVPTTAGTGSEVSPNAILLDEKDEMKKAVISPYLVPDGTYVDPVLTESVPPAATAATGIDALTHCIEAYANVNAHPLVDAWALQGISLIGSHLERAVKDGTDYEAREAVALGSVLGGMCLGPVNTAGVHALAYPLGGRYHIAHGLSIAIMLPYVLRFSLPAMPGRYGQIARSLGVSPLHGLQPDLAEAGVEKLTALISACGLRQGLADLGVSTNDLPGLVEQGLSVKRLLKNNPREVTAPDALAIYTAAMAGH